MKEYQSKTFDEFCKDECPYDFQSCMPPDDCPFMEEDDDFEDDDYEDDNYDDDGSYEEQLRSELINLIEKRKGVKELKQ